MEDKNLEAVDKAINLIFEGYSLRSALYEVGLNLRKFYSVLRKQPSLSDAYLEAQRAKSEAYVEEIIDISDTEEDLNRARLKVDVRKWYASKIIPHKYGERLDMNITHTVDLTEALTDARSRLIPNDYLKEIDQTQTIDIIDTSSHKDADRESVLAEEDDPFT